MVRARISVGVSRGPPSTRANSQHRLSGCECICKDY